MYDYKFIFKMINMNSTTKITPIFFLFFQILPMPKYTSQVVYRFLKPLSVAYHEIATTPHATIKNRETYVRDKNMGLVYQASPATFKCYIEYYYVIHRYTVKCNNSCYTFTYTMFKDMTMFSRTAQTN